MSRCPRRSANGWAELLTLVGGIRQVAYTRQLLRLTGRQLSSARSA
jgi:NAD(P)H-dependent FMN reductase